VEASGRGNFMTAAKATGQAPALGTWLGGTGARVPRRQAQRRPDGSCLEVVVSGSARTPRRARHAARDAGPCWAGCRRVGSTLERDRADFQPVNLTLTVNFSNHLNCATKMLDTKVVNETSLYNICKGRHRFG
jgi:hypothetical protein